MSRRKLRILAAIALCACVLLLVIVARPVRLYAAARAGDLARVEELLKRPGNVNVSDPFGWTALHWAASLGHDAIVESLLQAGADMDARDNYGWTPLHCATAQHRSGTVKLLAQAGADLDARIAMGAIPERRAARWGYYTPVRDADERLQVAMVWGEAALHMASVNGDLPIIEALLAHGASVDLRRIFRDEDSLHLAAQAGKADVVEVLIAAGADIEAQSGFFGTPLMYAVVGDHPGTVALLLLRGVDSNARHSSFGDTALHYCRDVECARLLLDAGAAVNARDNYGHTPLYDAAMGGITSDIARFLEKHGGVQ